ncbi:MAG TPA: Na+/H+ antiporter subunit D [Aggregatilineales bacterium]|nr:Na+/H+ antiporter subunit D [Aggregatilineales bacterium]
MNVLLILPIAVPLITAILCVFGRRSRPLQRSIALLGTGVLVFASLALLASVYTNGIQTTQLGNWEAPFGISFVADTFAAIMVVMTALVGFTVVIFSFANVDEPRRRFGYFPVMMTLLMGVNGAFLTGDMFNLYVWFEVMLISSFVLMALGNERMQIEGAIKYFVINIIGSTIFLAADGLLYGLTGTLNMADLAVTIERAQPQGMIPVVASLFLIAFGIKAAIFPLFFWLPSSYHTPPIAVTALFSGLMTKVGVYTLVRVFTLIFTEDQAFFSTVFLVIAGLTMIVGVIGAVAQYDMRRLLSFHIISQIGYLIMGLGIFTVSALTGTVYFMIHVIIAKSALFFVSGVSAAGFRTYNLNRLGGLYRGYPLLALLFFLPAMSLAGIPPLSGFWAKLTLITAGLEAEQYLIVAVGLGVSVLTMFSMVKIWAEAFWKKHPVRSDTEVAAVFQAVPAARMTQLLIPVVLLAALTVLLGVFANPVLVLSQQAAEQLMNPGGYISAVLGGR